MQGNRFHFRDLDCWGSSKRVLTFEEVTVTQGDGISTGNGACGGQDCPDGSKD
jgi:hypothetical protein